MSGVIAILVPVLRRPHRIRPLMESVAAGTSVAYRLLFIASPGDPGEIDELQAAGADFIVMAENHSRGDYARKIHLGLAHTTEPWLVTGADDLDFHKGWDARLGQYTAHVIGTNDMGNPRVVAGDHATHFIVSRHYAEHFGTIDGVRPAIFHEGYWHEGVDDELIGTAQLRGLYFHDAEARIEHLHPHWGKAPSDQLYAMQHRRLIDGQRILRQRRHLWGDDGTPKGPRVHFDATVLIGTYGSELWRQMGEQRAAEVAKEFWGIKVIHVHHPDSLHEARNAALAAAKTEWVVFLDADDTIEPGYFNNLATDDADIFVPKVRFVRSLTNPRVTATQDMRVSGHQHHCTGDCLTDGNYIVIGAVARRSTVIEAGGFRDYEVYEDYDLWLRCWLGDARFADAPGSVYRAQVRRNSRNRSGTQEARNAVHRRIVEDNGLEWTHG